MRTRLLNRRLACIFPADPPDENGGGGTGGGGASGAQQTAGDAGGEDRGYPADTPIAEMTDAQQAAYWKHQSVKHERAWKGKLGTYTPDQVSEIARENERLRQASLTDAEKAVQEAEERGRQAALTELRPRLVESAFRSAAGQRSLPAEQIDTLWEGVNPTAFLTDTGEVDTDKVTRYLGAITPTEDPTTGLYRTGAGHQEQIKQTGREAGLAEAQKRFGTTS